MFFFWKDGVDVDVVVLSITPTAIQIDLRSMGARPPSEALNLLEELRLKEVLSPGKIEIGVDLFKSREDLSREETAKVAIDPLPIH
jgi:hypothetical protein